MVLNREITPPDRWPIMIPMRRLSFVVGGAAGTQVRSSRCLRRRSIEGLMIDHAVDLGWKPEKKRSRCMT
jgi:hypothetical protein